MKYKVHKDQKIELCLSPYKTGDCSYYVISRQCKIKKVYFFVEVPVLDYMAWKYNEVGEAECFPSLQDYEKVFVVGNRTPKEEQKYQNVRKSKRFRCLESV